MHRSNHGLQPKVIWLCPPGGAVTLEEGRLVLDAVGATGCCLLGGEAGGGASGVFLGWEGGRVGPPKLMELPPPGGLRTLRQKQIENKS